MSLKAIKLTEVERILKKAEEYELKKKKLNDARPVKIHPETYSSLKAIQKANNIKSISMTIDLLIMTTALAQIADVTEDEKTVRERIMSV